MKKRKPSRLNPGYLALRHAGMVFMCVALGVVGGLIAKTYFQPTRYRAATSVDAAVMPPDAAGEFDWNEQLREWRFMLANRRDQGLLSVNLRHVVKLAVTQDLLLDTGTLPDRLARLEEGELVSTLLLPYPAAVPYTPHRVVRLDELAENLDLQSLAAIVSDLRAPPDVEGWDFSFFQSEPILAARDGIIVNPGPDDRYFRVFYALAAALNPTRQPATPLEAWKNAVATVSDRLSLEREMPGAGGFGHTAMRELVREIVAIPALVANGLYATSDWLPGDGADEEEPVLSWITQWSGNTTVNLERLNATGGLVEVAIVQDLYPLEQPRDTIITRVAALASATLLAYLGAHEREEIILPMAPPPAPAETTEPEPAPAAEPPPQPAPAATTVEYREMIDDIANQARLSRISMLEEAVRMAEIDRDAALRQLDSGRETENRLSFEAVNARLRADRLEERYERALGESDRDNEPSVPPEAAELFKQRDAAYHKLVELLETCTEEHPFVRAARRDLAAKEALLADLEPDARANREAEARATRLATLYLEWENAVATADSLDERARRQSEAVACYLDDVTEIERSISRCQMELAAARAEPVPILRAPVVAEVVGKDPPLVEYGIAELPPLTEPTPAPAARPEPDTATAETPAPAADPAVAGTPVQAEVPAVRVGGPRLVLGTTPVRIPLERRPPSWRAVYIGALAGLCLGLLGMAFRELFARRFRNAYEARRLVGLPVLLSLPAYDAKSQRNATRTMKGMLQRTAAGRLQFVPVPVEIEEPAPLARRGAITPARKLPRLLGWILGLVLLGLAGLLYRASARPILQPVWPSGPELSLPSVTLRAWSEEGDVWGDQP